MQLFGSGSFSRRRNTGRNRKPLPVLHHTQKQTSFSLA
jgi:hypothetical protein